MYIWVNILNKYFPLYSNYKKNQYMICTKVIIINVSVTVWIRMIPTVSYIWMLNTRRLNCVKGLERLGGMAFLEEVCHLGWVLRFQKPRPGQPLFPCLRILRYCSSSMCVAIFPTIMIMYWPSATVNKQQLNYSLCSVHGVSSQQ